MELAPFLKEIDQRDPTLRQPHYAYKLAQGSQYAYDVVFPDQIDVDEKRMALRIPFAAGKQRDGVGDYLEVGGIRTDRHRANPICLYDHGKTVSLPIGMAEDPVTRQYTVRIDPVEQEADLLCFFYAGKGLPGIDKSQEYDHAVFCEQLFDMAVKRYVRAGSIGYSVIQAKHLSPNYDTGTPAGLHLLSVLMLEGSLVVLPAHQDTVRKCLNMPTMCGKALSPYLVKSLQQFAPLETKTVSGFGTKGDVPTEKVGTKAIKKARKPGCAKPTKCPNGETKPCILPQGHEDACHCGWTGENYTVRAKALDALKQVAAQARSAGFQFFRDYAGDWHDLTELGRGGWEWENVNLSGGNIIAVSPEGARFTFQLRKSMNAAIKSLRQKYGKSRQQSDPKKSIPADLNWQKEEAAEPEHNPPKVRSQKPMTSQTKTGKKSIDELEEARALGRRAADAQNDGDAARVQSEREHFSRWLRMVGGRGKYTTGQLHSAYTEEYKANRAVRGKFEPFKSLPANAKNIPPAKWKPGAGAEGCKSVKSQGQPCSTGETASRSGCVPSSGRGGTGLHPGSGGPKKPRDMSETELESAMQGRFNREIADEITRRIGGKSLDALRKKYKTVKGVRRRLRKSSPGSSVVRVREKDLQAARDACKSKGVKFQHLGEKGGYVKAKLTGDDDAIDELAKDYGRRGWKSLDQNGKALVPRAWNHLIDDAPAPMPVGQCFNCEGEGKVTCSACHGHDDTKLNCKECHGSGLEDCVECDRRKSLKRNGKKSLESKLRGALEWLDFESDRYEDIDVAEDGSAYVGLTQILPRGSLSKEEIASWENKSMKSKSLNSKEKSLRSIRVTWNDGDTTTTDINGTDLEITQYYVGNWFNVGGGEDDVMKKAVKVEFLDQKSKSLNSKEKSMSIKAKTKDLPADEMGGMTPGDQPPPPLPDEADAPVEKYSAQVLRAMHEDFSKILQDYDEMRQMLEHEGIDAHLEKALTSIAEHLEATEELFSEVHADLEPLGGGAGEKDLDEGESESDVAVDPEGDDDGAVPDASDDNVEPSPDEVIEGMETGEDEELDREGKSMKVKHRKALDEDEDEKNEKQLRRIKAMRRHMKSCGCGKENCDCEKCMKARKSWHAKIKAMPGEIDGEEGVNADDESWGEKKPSKGLQSHEKAFVKDAHGFLGEVSEAQTFDDEGRNKAYHYHKTLEGIGQIEDSADDAMGDPTMPAAGKAYDDADNMPPDALAQQPGGEVEAGTKSHRKMCKGASEYFGRLSKTRDFGDAHREEAKYWHSNLEPVAKEDEEMEPETKDASDGDPLEDAVEDPAFEPGEMGEKSEQATDKEVEDAIKNDMFIDDDKRLKAKKKSKGDDDEVNADDESWGEKKPSKGMKKSVDDDDPDKEEKSINRLKKLMDEQNDAVKKAEENMKRLLGAFN